MESQKLQQLHPAPSLTPVMAQGPNAGTVIKIAHLADIHIEDRRRDEYGAVFAALYTSLRGEAPNIIVVAGDVFDNKMRASANNLTDVGSFLAELSAIAPVVMIAGNHDTNCLVRGSPDLLTPVVRKHQHLQPPDLTYWRNSGVYLAHSIVWTVVAPDAPLTPPEEEEQMLAAMGGAAAALPRICLFHEELIGAKYPNGEEIRDHRLTTAALSRYDAALGGHIHLRQNTTARVGYCGSLVQQNMGESHTGHGYLIWEIRPTSASSAGYRTAVPSVRGVDIPNEQGFVRIEVDASGADITEAPIPANPLYWELVHAAAAPADSVQDHIARHTRTFKKAPRAVRLRPSRCPLAPGDLAQANAALAELHTAQDAAISLVAHEEIIREILAASGAGQYLEEVLTLHRAKYRPPAYEAGAKVRIRRIKFDNLYAFGANNEVDFTQLEGCVSGVIAPNHTGKSSLIDALAFALYDAHPRTSRKAEIVRAGSATCRVELEFEIGDSPGKITKVYDSRANRPGGYHLQYKGQNLTQGNTPDTQKEIGRIVGCSRTAFATSFQLQGSEMAGFVGMAPLQRKELLAEILSLGSFDALEAEIAKDVKALNGALKALAGQHGGVALGELVRQCDAAEREATQAATELRILAQQAASANAGATTASLVVGKDAERSREAQRRILEAGHTLKRPTVSRTVADTGGAAESDAETEPEMTLADAAATAEAWAASAGVTLDSTDVLTAETGSGGFQRPLATSADLARVIIPITREVVEFATAAELAAARESAVAEMAARAPAERAPDSALLVALRAIHRPAEGCETCKATSRLLETHKNEAAEAAAAARARAVEASVAAGGAKTVVTNLRTERAARLAAAAQWKRAARGAELRAAQTAAAAAAAAARANFETAHEKALAAEQARERAAGRESALQATAATLRERCSAESRLSASQAAAAHKLAVLQAYQTVLRPKNGIADKLLERARGPLQSRINDALTELGAKFEVRITPEYLVDHRARGPVGEETPDAGPWLACSLASGYQKFALSLAARLAMWRLARAPRPDALVIDEGFGVCDDSSLDAMAGALESLAGAPGAPRLIFVVSHLEGLKSRLARAVTITCQPGGSHINTSGPSPRPPPEQAAAATPQIAVPIGKPVTIEGASQRRTKPVNRCELCGRDIQKSGWKAHLNTQSHRRQESALKR